MKIVPMQAGVLGSSVPRKLSYDQKARKPLAFLSYGTRVFASNLYVHRGGSITCGSTVTCHQLALVYFLLRCRAFAEAVGFPHTSDWICTAHLRSSWCCKSSRGKKKYNFQANESCSSLKPQGLNVKTIHPQVDCIWCFWRQNRKQMGRSGLTDILITTFWNT